MSDPAPEESHVPNSESEEVHVPSDSEARSPLIADKKSRYTLSSFDDFLIPSSMMAHWLRLGHKSQFA